MMMLVMAVMVVMIVMMVLMGKVAKVCLKTNLLIFQRKHLPFVSCTPSFFNLKHSTEELCCKNKIHRRPRKNFVQDRK